MRCQPPDARPPGSGTCPRPQSRTQPRSSLDRSSRGHSRPLSSTYRCNEWTRRCSACVRRCAFKGRRECAAVSIVVHRFRTGSPYRKTVSAVHLLLSPSHESSSDVYDFRVCSPTLQRVLDESGTSLNDCSCKIAEYVGPFSAMDVYNMQPSMFTSFTGEVQAIELAKRVLRARASLPSKQGSVRGGDNAFLRLWLNLFLCRSSQAEAV